MATRLATIMAMMAFCICLVEGLMVENPFETTVSRALAAMAATMVIGLIVGAMAQRMLDENLKSEEEKWKKNSASSRPADR